MYVSYMVERFHDTTFDEDTITQIHQAIDLLEEAISKLNEAGEEVPEEITDELDALERVLKTSNTWGAAKDATRAIAGILYGLVIDDALKAVGYDQEAPEIYGQMTSPEECAAMTRGVTYLLLYDDAQSEKVISFEHVSQQIKHLATFIDNASRYQLPHMNEAILSWLRTLDPTYEGFVKENAAQKAGYRRLYMEQPDGVSVTGTVKDSSGKEVAQFKDGELTSRTDPWIGVTTCDTGNWLRLPADGTYRVELQVNHDARLDLKVAEYSVFEGREVRTVTRDEQYDWTGLAVQAADTVTWTIPAVPGSDYEMPSRADYTIEITTRNPFDDVSKDAYYYVPVLRAAEKGITNGIDQTHFGPDLACTRGQGVTFLYRSMK